MGLHRGPERRAGCTRRAPGTSAAGAAVAPAVLARSVVFATLAVGLAGTAHMLAGGQAPSVVVSLLAVAVVTWAGALLAHRERDLPSIVAAVALTQLTLHPVFAAFPEHAHAAAGHLTLATSGAATGRTWQMDLGHAGAALLLAWWLRGGEARTYRLARVVLIAAGRQLAGVAAVLELWELLRSRATPPRPARVAPRTERTADGLNPSAVTRTLRRRGPPAGVVAATTG